MECNWKFLWAGGLKLMLPMSGYKRYPYPPMELEIPMGQRVMMLKVTWNF